MRRALAEGLEQLAATDTNLIFITADLGFGVFDQFKHRFPNQFINVGIAEAGMVGLAAGLSKAGFVPVIYSIASFMNSRAYEQIRVLAGYNQCKMVIVGAGGGLTYSKSGPTHHALDDLGLALLIPTISVAAPSGPNELKEVLAASVNSQQSTYIQIGKFGEKDVQESLVSSTSSFRSANLVISSGGASQIVSAAKGLAKNLFDWVHLTYLRPLNKEIVIHAIKDRQKILVVEESWENSGLYNEIVLLLQREKLLKDVIRLGPPRNFIFENKSLNSMQEFLGYSAEQIIKIFKI